MASQSTANRKWRIQSCASYFLLVLCLTGNLLPSAVNSAAAQANTQTPQKPHPDVIALLTQARTLAQEGKLAESLAAAEGALKRAVELGDSIGQAESNLRISSALIAMGKPKDGMARIADAIATFQKSGYVRGESRGYNALGIAHWNAGDFKTAEEQFKKKYRPLSSGRR